MPVPPQSDMITPALPWLTQQKRDIIADLSVQPAIVCQCSKADCWELYQHWIKPW
jgi:hypothetical protein